MADQGILAQSKPAAATNTLLYSAPIDQSASTILNVANDGTGAAYDVAVKNYDQKLTLDASTYLLHEGDRISAYRINVDQSITSAAGFQGGQLITTDSGEKSFRFETFYKPEYTEIFVKEEAIRAITVESVTGDFAVGDTITKGAGGDTSTATLFALNLGSGSTILYIGPSTLNGSGTEFTAGDSVSTAGGASATISTGGVGTAENEFMFSTTTAGGTYNLFNGTDTLTLFNDRTYRFNLSDSSLSGLDFKISTTVNGEWGPDGDFTATADNGVEYTQDKTSNGTPGSSGAYIQYAFGNGTVTVSNLYYYEGTTGTAANANYGGSDRVLAIETDPEFTEFYIYNLEGGTLTNNVDSFEFNGTTYTVTGSTVGPYGIVRSYSGTTLTVIKTGATADFASSDVFQDVPKSDTAARSFATVSSVSVATTAVEDQHYIAKDVTNAANNVDKITQLVVGPGERVIVESATQNNVFSLIGFEDTSTALTERVYGTASAAGS
jgi:hypothetical protein